MLGKAIASHFQLKHLDILQIENFSAMLPGIPYIKFTHDDLPQHKRPNELEESKIVYKQSKVVFLIRDPRDVIVSLYFQKTKRVHQYTGTLSEFLYREQGSFNSLLHFYNIWAENRKVPEDFLLIRYEDIHKDPQGELRKVLNFIDLPEIPDDVIHEAVQYASFENMRQLEIEDRFSSKSLRAVNERDYESYKTRKGIVGGFRTYLKENEVAYLDKKIKDDLSDFYWWYKN